MDATELKRRREKAGLTQVELGKLVGVTSITISHYESVPNKKRKTNWKIPPMAQVALDKVLREHKV